MRTVAEGHRRELNFHCIWSGYLGPVSSIALPSGQHGGTYWEIFASVLPNVVEAARLA
jgi:hypothetical protein